MEKLRYFIDVDKEIKWLNEMSEAGYRLIDKDGWGNYYFMECKVGVYSYYVEDRLVVDAKHNKQYREFLQEMGIEMVAKSMGRYYFEKEADGKPFEIYTDVTSKIKAYTRRFPALLIIAALDMLLLYDQSIELSGPWILGMSISLMMQVILLVAVVITGMKYLMKMVHLKVQSRKDMFSV